MLLSVMSKTMMGMGIIWLINNVHIQKVLNRSQIGNALSLHTLLFQGQTTFYKERLYERTYVLFIPSQ